MASQLLPHLLDSPGPQLGRHGRLAMAQGQLRSEQVEEAEQLQHSSGRAGAVALRRFLRLFRVGEAEVRTEVADGVGEEARLDPARVTPKAVIACDAYGTSAVDNSSDCVSCENDCEL